MGRPLAVTIRDVAALAGTSIAAVSSALSGKGSGNIRVSAETRRRIIEAAEQLGYVPNETARSLATGRTGVLGLVLPYSGAFTDQNPFCTHVMRGVFHAAVDKKLNLMLYTAFQEGQAVDPTQISNRVDGMVIVLPPRDSILVRHCRTNGVPAVAVVAHPGGGVAVVNSDDFRGGYLGTKHLLDIGHRRIALLGGVAKVSTSAPRREGYLAALREAGIEPSPELELEGGFDTRLGHASMLRLLDLPADRRPTAVFALNDLCADGAMSAIWESGLRVPDDIAVVGYDDTEFAETTRPSLTSVRMGIDELGVTAVQCLLKQLEGNPMPEMEIVLPVSLTVRDSCGARRLPQQNPTDHHSSTEDHPCNQ